MKKILVVALSAVMALSLVSCSNGGDSSMSGEPSNSSVSDNLNNESSLEPVSYTHLSSPDWSRKSWKNGCPFTAATAARNGWSVLCSAWAGSSSMN